MFTKSKLADVYSSGRKLDVEDMYKIRCASEVRHSGCQDVANHHHHFYIRNRDEAF